MEGQTDGKDYIIQHYPILPLRATGGCWKTLEHASAILQWYSKEIRLLIHEATISYWEKSWFLKNELSHIQRWWILCLCRVITAITRNSSQMDSVGILSLYQTRWDQEKTRGQWPFLHLLWGHAFFVYSLSKVVIKVFPIPNTLQIGDRGYREAHENYNISRVHFILWEFHTTPFDHVLLPQCLPDSPPHWYPLNFMFSFFF